MQDTRDSFNAKIEQNTEQTPSRNKASKNQRNTALKYTKLWGMREDVTELRQTERINTR